jgi:hypothetical protein
MRELAGAEIETLRRCAEYGRSNRNGSWDDPATRHKERDAPLCTGEQPGKKYLSQSLRYWLLRRTTTINRPTTRTTWAATSAFHQLNHGFFGV